MAKSMKKMVAKKVTVKKMDPAGNVKIGIIYYRQHSSTHKMRKITNNGTYICRVCKTIFLVVLHVSTLMYHHQVLSVTHYLLLNYNAIFVYEVL
jgi:hypothetical protein